MLRYFARKRCTRNTFIKSARIRASSSAIIEPYGLSCTTSPHTTRKCIAGVREQLEYDNSIRLENVLINALKESRHQGNLESYTVFVPWHVALVMRIAPGDLALRAELITSREEIEPDLTEKSWTVQLSEATWDPSGHFVTRSEDTWTALQAIDSLGRTAQGFGSYNLFFNNCRSFAVAARREIRGRGPREVGGGGLVEVMQRRGITLRPISSSQIRRFPPMRTFW